MQEAVQNRFKGQRDKSFIFVYAMITDSFVKHIKVKQHSQYEIGYGIGSESET